MNPSIIVILITALALLAGLSVVGTYVVRSSIESFRAWRAAKPRTVKNRTASSRPRLRITLALLAVVAIASTSVGVTLALYSNRPTGETNTFVAGTVGLTSNVTGACLASTANMAPADTASCTLLTTYAGNLSGYLALDVFIATTKTVAVGATNLYNPADTTNQAQITVSSTTPTVTYVVAGGSPTSFGTAITCPGSGTSLDGVNYSTGYTCYLLSNLLVSATAFTNASATVTFTTAITLPSTQPNSYQGSSATVVLGAHAVQSRNNTINCTAGGASPTAGAVCTPAGSFAWS
ncbi:MAG: hypothetical protein QOH36_2309 [Actinomycetota bacterium]|nr:hypothetical protein [Actinomycetota bacterium]